MCLSSCQLLQWCRNVLLCLDCAECFVSMWVSTISSWLGAKRVFPFREVRPDCAARVFRCYAFMVKYSDSAHNVSFTLTSVQWVLVDSRYISIQASAGKPELHESKQRVLETAVSTFPCILYLTDSDTLGSLPMGTSSVDVLLSSIPTSSSFPYYMVHLTAMKLCQGSYIVGATVDGFSTCTHNHIAHGRLVFSPSDTWDL